MSTIESIIIQKLLSSQYTMMDVILLDKYLKKENALGFGVEVINHMQAKDLVSYFPLSNTVSIKS